MTNQPIYARWRNIAGNYPPVAGVVCCITCTVPAPQAPKDLPVSVDTNGPGDAIDDAIDDDVQRRRNGDVALPSASSDPLNSRRAARSGRHRPRGIRRTKSRDRTVLLAVLGLISTIIVPILNPDIMRFTGEQFGRTFPQQSYIRSYEPRDPTLAVSVIAFEASPPIGGYSPAGGLGFAYPPDVNKLLPHLWNTHTLYDLFCRDEFCRGVEKNHLYTTLNVPIDEPGWRAPKPIATVVNYANPDSHECPSGHTSLLSYERNVDGATQYSAGPATPSGTEWIVREGLGCLINSQ